MGKVLHARCWQEHPLQDLTAKDPYTCAQASTSHSGCLCDPTQLQGKNSVSQASLLIVLGCIATSTWLEQHPWWHAGRSACAPVVLSATQQSSALGGPRSPGASWRTSSTAKRPPLAPALPCASYGMITKSAGAPVPRYDIRQACSTQGMRLACARCMRTDAWGPRVPLKGCEPSVSGC